MNEHLLLVTLGPVQEFIAQARRTRDLWYGSHLLSELGRAAARVLLNEGAQLAFPALDKGDPELEACAAPVRRNGQPPLNIPNKLVATVPANVDPADLARKVRSEVRRHWREGIAAQVKSDCKGLLASGIDEVWDEQIDTLVEFLASWAKLDNYAEARRAVERAIAGRKNLRDFDAWRHTRGAVPKSSLDGARETVMREHENRDPHLVRKYRIAKGEQLDAVALVKRAGGEPDQFVPVVNIAAARWVVLADSAAAPKLRHLREACCEIGISRVERRDLSWTELFPFDASVLFPNRWRSVFQELGIEGDAELWGREYVGPLLKEMHEPYPYVACLVADGDHMGRALDLLSDKTQHRDFSPALSKFATSARNIVEREHSGVLIYSGGGDVLAFLPLPEALACAEDLRRTFDFAIGSACGPVPANDRPTLSVGIGIGHIMEAMGDLLALGREAEREAKRERNSLAVLVDMRSGGRHTWSAQWDDDPAGSLRRSMEHLDELLSTRKLYEIASILRRLPPGSADARWATVMSREVRRALSRAGERSLTADQVGPTLNGSRDYDDLRLRVSAWVNRLLIARVLSRAEPQQRARSEEVAV